jgi:hypothetical protein
MTEPIPSIRQHLICASKGITVKNNTGGARVNKVGHAFRLAGINDCLGAVNVDALVIFTRTPDTCLGGNVEDGIATTGCLTDVRIVGDFTRKKFDAT